MLKSNIQRHDVHQLVKSEDRVKDSCPVKIFGCQLAGEEICDPMEDAICQYIEKNHVVWQCKDAENQ